MLIRVVISLTLLVALSGSALAQEEIAGQLERARILKEEGKLGEAIEAFRRVILAWPDDTVHTPAAHLMLAETLIAAGRISDAEKQLDTVGKRYPDRKKLLVRAEEIRKLLRDRVDQLRFREQFQRDLTEQIEALEQKLKEQGLVGEDLEKMLQLEKRRLEVERRFAEAREQYERVRKLWEEQGVSPEQIRERAEKFEADRARLAAQQAELERVTRRLDEEGASQDAIEREISRLAAQALAEAKGLDSWKERHEEGMRERRREFIRLAEELGVPGEEAERLLEAHRKDRVRLDTGDEHARKQNEHLEHRLAGIEKRFDEIAMHMERFAQHMEMRNAELTRMTERLVKRVEELQRRVEEMAEEGED